MKSKSGRRNKEVRYAKFDICEEKTDDNGRWSFGFWSLSFGA